MSDRSIAEWRRTDRMARFRRPTSKRKERPKWTKKPFVITSRRDFTAFDQLMPHPVYGRQHWVCVLNPSERTFATLEPLLKEAYDRAVARITSTSVKADDAGGEE